MALEGVPDANPIPSMDPESALGMIPLRKWTWEKFLSPIQAQK